jgi:hypothetical protein
LQQQGQQSALARLEEGLAHQSSQTLLVLQPQHKNCHHCGSSLPVTLPGHPLLVVLLLLLVVVVAMMVLMGSTLKL